MGKSEVPKKSISRDFLNSNKISMWMAAPTATVMQTYGANPISTSGTLTARTPALTNWFTAQKRIGIVSGATAGNGGQFRITNNGWNRATGFRFVVRFGCSDAATVANAQGYAGMINAPGTNITSTLPSGRINFVALAHDTGDANLQIMHNDGTGSATKVDLGANFPKNTLSVDAYELIITCLPTNTSAIFWEVTRLNTGHRATGTITTDLPDISLLLSPQIYRTNGTTALAVGTDLFSLYVEDYSP